MSAQPFGPGRSGEGGARHEQRELRPEDVPDRPVSLRRVGRLFIPYRLRLGLLLGLIVLGSVLSVASPFLLREAVNKGIVKHDLSLLSWLVGGMIALAVINGVISVAQTLISNQVGQRVMHDLRAAVYAHLQRMSLAFFTRTRSGRSRRASPTTSAGSTTSSPAPPPRPSRPSPPSPPPSWRCSRSSGG